MLRKFIKLDNILDLTLRIRKKSISLQKKNIKITIKITQKILQIKLNQKIQIRNIRAISKRYKIRLKSQLKNQ
jgi:hypothetical protein